MGRYRERSALASQMDSKKRQDNNEFNGQGRKKDEDRKGGPMTSLKDYVQYRSIIRLGTGWADYRHD